MKQHFDTWAVVLAAGEGSRLRSLTRDERGVTVPKQFCSLQGGPCLLQEALQRAASTVPLQRICSVVAEQHRQWWAPILSYLPEQNVFSQPQNKGTAFGILLPLLRILERDPNATVLLLPADHYLSDEKVMAASLRRAAAFAQSDPGSIYLLGVEPDEPDTELGYILPEAPGRTSASAVCGLSRNQTRPEPACCSMREHCGMFSSWPAAVRTLLSLFDNRFATTIAAMRGFEGASLDSIYQNLRSVDFSRDVLQGRESMLKVLTVPRAAGPTWAPRKEWDRSWSSCKISRRRLIFRRM